MNPDAGKATLFLADEQELFREGLAALCEQSGEYHVVGQCGDGLTALRLIEQLHPVLLLLHAGLRSLHAFELVSRLRSARSLVKILILADEPDSRLALETIRGGANGVILRNGPKRRLFEALEQLLQGGLYLAPETGAHGLFEPGQPGAEADPLQSLSTREYQVFLLLVEGVRPKEIANRLDLSPKTVDSHRKNLMGKLGMHDVATLVKYAMKRNLIRNR